MAIGTFELDEDRRVQAILIFATVFWFDVGQSLGSRIPGCLWLARTHVLNVAEDDRTRILREILEG